MSIHFQLLFYLHFLHRFFFSLPYFHFCNFFLLNTGQISQRLLDHISGSVLSILFLFLILSFVVVSFFVFILLNQDDNGSDVAGWPTYCVSGCDFYGHIDDLENSCLLTSPLHVAGIWAIVAEVGKSEEIRIKVVHVQ